MADITGLNQTEGFLSNSYLVIWYTVCNINNVLGLLHFLEPRSDEMSSQKCPTLYEFLGVRVEAEAVQGPHL